MNTQKLSDWCERSVVFSFYALIYFLPISTALVEMFSAIIITAYFVKRGVVCSIEFNRINALGLPNPFLHKVKAFFKSFQAEPNPLSLPIGIFLIVNFLSCVFSQYPALSFKGFVFKLIQEVILYFAFLEYMKIKKQLQIFTGIYFVSATLIVINGLVEYFKGKGFIHGNLLKSGRVMSSFNHPNDLGAYLIFAVIAVLSFLMMFLVVSQSWKKKTAEPPVNGSRYFFNSVTQVGFLSLLIASLYCMGLTFSRGAWCGLLMGLLCLAVMRKKQFYIPVAVAIIFFMVFVPKLEKDRNVSFISDDIRHSEETFHEENSTSTYWNKVFTFISKFSGTGRMSFWQDAIGLIRQFPVLGVGLNTYTKMTEKNKVNLRVYPHNCYLQMAAETGLIGLASFLWILFRLFYNVVVNISRMKDHFLGALLVGVSVGLFGFLAHSFGDTNFYSVQLGTLLWVLMAVLVVTLKLDKI